MPLIAVNEIGITITVSLSDASKLRVVEFLRFRTRFLGH